MKLEEQFIDAALEEKPIDAKAAFGDMITQKLDVALDAMKTHLAQNMFGTSEEESTETEVELSAEDQAFLDSLSDEELEALANMPDEEEEKIDEEKDCKESKKKKKDSSEKEKD